MKKRLLAMVSILLIIMQFANCFAYGEAVNENFIEEIKLSENDILDERLMNDRYIVKFKENTGTALQSLVQKFTGYVYEKRFDEKIADLADSVNLEFDISEITKGIKVIEFSEKISVDTFVNKLSAEIGQDSVEYIQPDYLLDLASDDIELTISVTDAEEIFEANTKEIIEDTVAADSKNLTDSDEVETTINDVILEEYFTENVKIAVIDSGVDISHNAFYSRIANSWDFVNDCELTYSYAENGDYHHGTHVTGIIANNVPNAKIMPLKVFEGGKAYTSDIIEAIEFAESNGATIVNCSWGSMDNNAALKEAMENSDMLFVCAVGNNRLDLNQTPVYPACFALDNIISVTSVNNDKGLSYFSNYNENLVDVAAPGRNIYSTFPDNQYGEMSGTSMSAAYVTAMAAIAEAKEYENIKSALLSTSDKMSNLYGKVSDGRCVNVDNLKANIISENIIQNTPVEDFDESGYEMTPAESWELFCSLDNVQVSAGAFHMLALKSDGTVWAWGENYQGKLGNGNTEDSSTPVQVTGLNNVIQICASSNHNIALKNDGTVWTWGGNPSGVLGNGTTTSSYVPIQVLGLSNIVQISSTVSNHTLALDKNGAVWSWGNNSCGQLGDGTTTNRTLPVQVTNFNNISQVAAGGMHSIALKNDGTVWSWGDNGYGQLGNGKNTGSAIPVCAAGLNNIIQISAGGMHSLALKSDGTAYGSGHNLSGQLGDNTTVNKNNYVQILLNNVISVLAGSMHSVLLNCDGDVFCCGYNLGGQLGNGTTTDKIIPTKITSISGVIQASAGDMNSMMLTENGIIYICGDNSYGQLGSSDYIYSSVPVAAAGQINDTQGNTYDNAHEIADNGVFQGSINTNGDCDWYKFTATCSGMYTIYTESSIDTYGELYTEGGAAAGTSFVNGNDGGNGLNFSMSANITAGHIYYLKVGRYASGAGAYTLHIVKPDVTLISTEFQLSCIPGQEFTLNLSASHVTSFNNKVFEVIYDNNKVLLTDALALEYGERILPGRFGNIEILSVLPGHAVFRIVDVNIPADKAWSGLLNAMKFKFAPACSGTSVITFQTN